jgi:hypothetical protein
MLLNTRITFYDELSVLLLRFPPHSDPDPGSQSNADRMWFQIRNTFILDTGTVSNFWSLQMFSKQRPASMAHFCMFQNPAQLFQVGQGEVDGEVFL